MHIVPQRFARSAAIGQRPIVAAVLCAFAFVVIVVTALVLAALNNVTENANMLDDARSRETTAGALMTFRDQLGATLNDYAAWDDAAEFVYRPDGQDWVDSNYGSMTINSELFDTAIVVDDNQRPLTTYQNGQKVEWTMEDYFSGGLDPLIDLVRSMKRSERPEVTGFVMTKDGIAAVGVALVRMKSGVLNQTDDNRRYLIFARHLGQDKIDRLAQTYVINALTLEKPNYKSQYYVNILNPLGEVLGKLVWQSQAPGDVSYSEVRPIVFTAVAIAGLFFLALFLIGTKALHRLKTDEAEAREESIRDRLSGLHNRSGLFSGMANLVERARHENFDIQLLYLDLDGFKEINDSYGHGTGDRLIKGVAAGLKVLVPEHAILARLGGDEFAIVLCGSNVEEEGHKLSQELLQLFSEPFTIGVRVAAIGCSIGSAISAAGSIDAEELLRRADMAMYQAKETGRGRYVTYTDCMDAMREEKNQLEADLRRSLDKGELHVVFQPVVNATSRRITGVEALARWNRAGHGPVSPDVFIPVAEASGLIDQIGLFVLRNACETARQWPDIKLAVNISPVQFRNPAFAGHVSKVMVETGMEPERLRLEMTEGYFIHHPERASLAIEKLKQLGVSIALDDFGAGFASVGYLRRFGFNRMKIDRSLVMALDNGGRSLDMLKATVALARSLDIPVTAEGIETEDQAKVLQHCGCDELQGYLFSKPLPQDAITALLDHQRKMASTVRVKVR